jgi:hypothetical protein
MILFQDYIRLSQVVSSQPGRYVTSSFYPSHVTTRMKEGREKEGRKKEQGTKRKERANNRHAQSVDHQRLSENSSRNHTRKI